MGVVFMCGQGGANPKGNAQPSDVVNGKTFSITGEPNLMGTMPVVGENVLLTTKAQSVNIPIGYHDGTHTIQIDPAEKAKIVSANIMTGKTILGVNGSAGAFGLGNNVIFSNVSRPYTTSTTFVKAYGAKMNRDGNYRITVLRLVDQGSQGQIQIQVNESVKSTASVTNWQDYATSTMDIYGVKKDDILEMYMRNLQGGSGYGIYLENFEIKVDKTPEDLYPSY